MTQTFLRQETWYTAPDKPLCSLSLGGIRRAGSCWRPNPVTVKYMLHLHFVHAEFAQH